MDHTTHDDHSHQHGAQCSHTAIEHADHVDYLYDGHLHRVHDGNVDEHVLEVTAANPADCTATHQCGGHEPTHEHAPGCGHEQVPHGKHVDYLVKGHLHNAHGSHCDDHGVLVTVS